MKLMYVVALSVFVLGLALLLHGTANEGDLNILGLAVHSRITKGLGLITMIFMVTFSLLPWS